MLTTCRRCGICYQVATEEQAMSLERFCPDCDVSLEYYAGTLEAHTQEHWDPSPSDLAHLRRALIRCNLDAPEDAELARNGVNHMRRVILHVGRAETEGR